MRGCKKNMTKKQKISLVIFGAMFVVPEILFSFATSSFFSVVGNFSKTMTKPLAYILIGSQFFDSHPLFLFIILIIEWLGTLGLLIISFKSHKIIATILVGVLWLWISFIVFLSYAIGFSMSFL